MLIALYFFIVNVVLPQVGAYAQALLEPIIVIVITLAGIVMIFGAVGINISNNLGSTVINGIFRAISYICHNLIQAISWIIQNIFRLVPIVFTGSRRTFIQIGLNPVLSNIFALIVSVVFLALVI